jgi:hypothetical protein
METVLGSEMNDFEASLLELFGIFVFLIRSRRVCVYSVCGLIDSNFSRTSHQIDHSRNRRV